MTALQLAGCVAAALLLAGCSSNSSPQTVDTSGGAYREVSAPADELIAQRQAWIADVPVPMGFKLDESHSRNFAAGGARYVDHLYKGKADKFAVARFYKRQMPVVRWVLVTDMFVQGENIMDFEKDTERCRIVVTQGGWMNPTSIKVQLWTSGRIEPSKEGKGNSKR